MPTAVCSRTPSTKMAGRWTSRVVPSALGSQRLSMARRERLNASNCHHPCSRPSALLVSRPPNPPCSSAGHFSATRPPFARAPAVTTRLQTARRCGLVAVPKARALAAAHPTRRRAFVRPAAHHLRLWAWRCKLSLHRGCTRVGQRAARRRAALPIYRRPFLYDHLHAPSGPSSTRRFTLRSLGLTTRRMPWAMRHHRRRRLPVDPLPLRQGLSSRCIPSTRYRLN